MSRLMFRPATGPEVIAAIGRCDACRHWKSPSERVDFTEAVTLRRVYTGSNDAEFERVRSEEDKADRLFGQCRAIEEGWELDPAKELPLAVVRDGSDYRADIFTRAEFGCVLFAAKETEPGGTRTA